MSDIDSTVSDLSPRQHALLTALLSGLSLEDCCKTARISVRTAGRYLKKNIFRERLVELQQQQLELVVARSHAIGDEALKILQSLSSDTKTPASARVASCRHLDGRRWTALEHGSLQNQLDEIRSMLRDREFES